MAGAQSGITAMSAMHATGIDMVKSTWGYRRLKDFRAGVEELISYLKRAFGLDRCTWKGQFSFGSYVWGSVLSANLLTLARIALN